MKVSRAFWVGALCIVLFFRVAAPAGANSFFTQEYAASTGLDSLGAAKAYARGFTGKGVIVGVVDDSFAPESGEFMGKYPYGILGDAVRAGNDHGMHVSGIIAARKDDIGMHGAAFDAQLLPWRWTKRSVFCGWEMMLQHKEVRIISNSWAIGWHLDSTYKAGFWDEILHAYKKNRALADTLAAQDKLVIMSAGNDGHIAPGFMAGLPTVLDRQHKKNRIGNNWLNVAAYNPAYPSAHPAFIWVSSNMGQGAADYTLLAPGVDIFSTLGDRQYGNMSGTSMAAPYVSGVAALVQQAFPYMGGKQLADVLLSTATPLRGAKRPPYFVMLRETYDIELMKTDTTIVAYSTTTVQATKKEKKALVEQISIYVPWDASTTAALLEAAINNPVILTNGQYNEVFGQGMVNAAKAVRGPGYFDARRLDPARDRAVLGGKSYAVYEVDTKGFESVWSNNIGERRATSGTLAGLGVGLRKSGAGLLHMTGANTYSGPTEIRGGGISLGSAGSSVAASLAGDVYVRSKGLLTGSGSIGGSLSSSGVLAPGFAGKPGSILAVKGSVKSTGTLRFILGPKGVPNFMTARAMDIRGSKVELARALGHYVAPYADYRRVLTAPGGIKGLGALPSTVSLSPFLVYRVAGEGDRALSLVADTRPLDSLSGMPSRTRAVAVALQGMFDGLEGSAQQERLHFLYNLSGPAFTKTASAMRGDVHAASLTNLPFTGMLQKLLPSGPSRSGTAAGPGGASNVTLASGADAGRLGLWMRPVFGYSKTDGKSSILQDSASSHMRGLALGLQREQGNVYGGALFAIGDGDVEQGGSRANIIDSRFGVYGGYTPGGLRLAGLVSGGWQHYKTDRRIYTDKGRDYMRSSFNGHTLGAGLEGSYNVLHGVTGRVAMSPYAALDADYIRQKDRKESGDGIFALDVKSKDYWRTVARLGAYADIFPYEWLTLSASAGYKRLLAGHNPTMDVAFKNAAAPRFEAVGPDEGRDYVTYSIGAEASLPHNVKLAARFFGENSNRSHSYSGYVNMLLEW